LKHRLSLISFLLIFLALGLPTLAAMQQVSGLFGEGRYEEARQSLGTSGDGVKPGEDILWRSRLSVDPDEAIALLKGSIQNPEIPSSTRVGMTLQLAQIYFARGQYEATNSVLSPLLAEATEPLPGEIYLLAGLTLRKAGKLQSAREMLASVKPDDPAFGAARYFLGDISLVSNDPELALRYFESGQKNSRIREFSRLKAGQWRALRASGQDSEADKLLEELKQESAGSLALVEIGRVLQTEKDENNARIASASEAAVDTVIADPIDTTGRYTLQLGAFSDRGLALEFKGMYQDQIPELEIVEIRDSMGQFFYKVRFGSFVNPALARSEAQRQKNILGTEVIVVELDPSAGGNR